MTEPCIQCGENTYGTLGDGTTTHRDTFGQVKGVGGTGYLTDIVKISGSSSSNTVLALKSDGTLYAWGRNNYGQLGDGTTTDDYKSTPVQVVGSDGQGLLTGVMDMSAGYRHCMAITKDGGVYTWGYNKYGQLGNGETSSSGKHPTPLQST